MTKLVAKFDFLNAEFDITEQTKNGLHIKIFRQLNCISNTQSAYKMPVGANGGLATKLIVTSHNESCDMVWELSNREAIIARGYISDTTIPLPLYYGQTDRYTLRLYKANTASLGTIKYKKNIDIATQRKTILLQIRNNIINQLPVLIAAVTPNISIRFGSEHMDNSGFNNFYKQSIRIEIPNIALYHVCLLDGDKYSLHIFSFVGPESPVQQSIIRMSESEINTNKILGIIMERLTTDLQNHTAKLSAVVPTDMVNV